MARRRVAVRSEGGLHGSVAARFVYAASRAPGEVALGRPGAEPADAKSILAVLGLDVAGGEAVELTVSGADAERWLDELARILRGLPL